jgi:hypothetical protein
VSVYYREDAAGRLVASSARLEADLRQIPAATFDVRCTDCPETSAGIAVAATCCRYPASEHSDESRHLFDVRRLWRRT